MVEEPVTGLWLEKGQEKSICRSWRLETRQVIWPHCHREPPRGNGGACDLYSLPFGSHHKVEMTSVDV